MVNVACDHAAQQVLCLAALRLVCKRVANLRARKVFDALDRGPRKLSHHVDQGGGRCGAVVAGCRVPPEDQIPAVVDASHFASGVALVGDAGVQDAVDVDGVPQATVATQERGAVLLYALHLRQVRG